MVPSVPPAQPPQPDDVGLAKVREGIFDVMGICWGIVEVTKNIHELKDRGIPLGNVQRCIGLCRKTLNLSSWLE